MTTPGLDHWADILIVVLYFVFVMVVGLLTLCRPNRNSVSGYFLAGRSMTWWPVGASLFSSNIGSEHFIGLAGTGAASGIAIVLYEWNSLPLVLCLGWLFLPVYISAGVYTLPEYLCKRFGGQRLRVYLSILTLVLYIVTKIAVSIYAGALFIQLALGWNMYLSIVALLAITGIYTVLGGLAAVMYTDALQTAIMMIGAAILVGLSFDKIGGYENLMRLYMQAVPKVRDNSTSCGLPREDAFHLFRHPVDSDLPWPGLLVQSSIGCLWYWCCDQVIVQRALAAKNLSHAKAGSILAGYLKLLPLFLMILPGMISRAMFPDEVGCSDPEICKQVCDNPVGCSNIAYPKLVLELLPVGVRGLLIAVMLSAIMSSLTSIFNSASAVFTLDLWRRIRKSAAERELLIVGRIFIVILCGVSILWIPLVRSSQGGQLFIYLQSVQAYLGTPIGALFLWAILWKRMNEKGAFWGILVGHACGIIRMILDFVYPAPDCGQPETRPSVLYLVHYSYFGPMLLVITSITIVGVSLFTCEQRDDELENVTWWTRLRPQKKNKKSENISDIELQCREDVGSSTSTEHAKTPCEQPKDESEAPPDIGMCRRWINFLCGMPTSGASEVKETSRSQDEAFLTQNRFWKNIININAVIALTIFAFLIGFFH